MKHPIQKQLLELSQKYDLEKMGLRQIGKIIGVEHPQKVKFHLEKIGLLKGGRKIRPEKRLATVPQTSQDSKVISLPILGLANCGDATMVAESHIEGMLSVSRKLLPKKHSSENLFAIKAVGSSMNRANINGKSINDGDYVIVSRDDMEIKNGDYVLSVISGLANIKRYVEDEKHEQVVLQSESDKFFPPIHIHKEDLDEYFLNGKVVEVIKEPREDKYSYEPIL